MAHYKVKTRYIVSLKDCGGGVHEFSNVESAKVFVRTKMGGRIANTFTDEVGVWCYGPSTKKERENGTEQAAYVIERVVNGKTFNECQNDR